MCFFILLKAKIKQKKQLMKAFVTHEKFEAAKKRRILNEKIKGENKILDFLKKNKYSDKEFHDEKIKEVAERLQMKKDFSFEIMKSFNLEFMISMISFLVQKTKQEKIDSFIEKTSRKKINRHLFAFFVIKINFPFFD